MTSTRYHADAGSLDERAAAPEGAPLQPMSTRGIAPIVEADRGDAALGNPEGSPLGFARSLRVVVVSRSIEGHAWLDIACPWCWIAKRRFMLAVEDYGGDVRIEYHSFELAPDLPEEYVRSESGFLQSSQSGLTRKQAHQMMWVVRSTGARLGLVYDFDAVHHTSTLLAHQLLHHAKANGAQDAMLEALFSAFFERGRDLRQIDELVALASNVGLDSGEARRVLLSGRYLDAVRADRDLAGNNGVVSIPTYVVDGQVIHGAKRQAVIAEVLRRVAQHPA